MLPTYVTPLNVDLVAADGDDASSFLQGQISADLRSLSVAQSSLAALNTARGRVIELFRILMVPDRILLILPSGHAASLIAHLSRYILRAKVTLTDVSDAYAVHGITAAASDQLSALPETPDRVASFASARVVRTHDHGSPRGLVIWPSAAGDCAIPVTLQKALGKTETGDIATWQRGEVLAGIPQLSAATREQFVAQMLNLDLLGGISHSKGCYTGQEIIARTHNLGRIKRRMLGFCSTTGKPPAPGAALVSVTDGGGRNVGTVVSAAAREHGGFDLLAVVRLSEPLDALAFRPGDPALDRFPLPYAIPELN